ncbi:MAG TPA: TonB family protein [Methylocella sp.]|nr:TonB family protein [Methylocella sp.]
MDLESERGRERQNLAADRREQFSGSVPGSAEAARSSRRFLANIVAVSLLAHGCLVLAILFLDQAPAPAERAREIPIELVKEPPPPLSKPAATPAGEKSSAPQQLAKRGPDAKGGQGAKGGLASLKAAHEAIANNDAAHERAPVSKPEGGPARQDEAIEKQWAAAGLMLPFDTGPERFRAVAVPLPSESGGEAMSYKVVVFGLLARVKHYPEPAIQRHARGIAVIGFVLDDAGGVVSVVLLRSSGDADLDAESVAVVNRAAPFPPPPPGAQHAFAAEVAFGMVR